MKEPRLLAFESTQSAAQERQTQRNDETADEK